MCSDPGDTSVLQISLALTFTTKGSKALILTALRFILRFILRFSAIPTSTQELHHFSVLQTSSPLPSRGFHTGACRSHGDLFQNGSPAILTLAHITVTGKKTTATASPSLPKMDFIKTLLLAMGLVSPLELQKRDVSADSK